MIEEIIKKVGTPTYVFDKDILIKRIKYLKKYFKKQNIVYAVKANTFIIKELNDYVERFEICSPGEFKICENLKIDCKKMVISGVYKDYETMDYIFSNCDKIGHFTIESVSQFELLNELSKKYDKKINVLIRLTSGNQFGVSEEDFKYIIKNSKNTNIIINGIEYFSGTQKHSLKKINKEVDYLVEFVDIIESEFDIKLNEIEYGTGFPVFYFRDEEFNEDEFFSEVSKILSKIKNREVSLEIGRSIAASCGYYLTSVVDMKKNKYGNHVIVDGGINHLVYYGQTMAMRIPDFYVIPKRKSKKEIYTLYGSLCTINDIIVKNLEINKLEKKDVFVFKNVGAYSVTEGISLFLSRDLPKVVICDKNSFKLVREDTNTSNINFPFYK